MDDVLIFARNQAEDDKRLEEALKPIEGAGAPLNPQKVKFSKTKLSHVIYVNRITADPEKTDSILGMRSSTNVSELRQFLRMANKLRKFTSKLAWKKLADFLVGKNLLPFLGAKHLDHLPSPTLRFLYAQTDSAMTSSMSPAKNSTLFGAKHLDCLITTSILRLDRFSYDIKHVPSKEPPTLSRAPLSICITESA